MSQRQRPTDETAVSEDERVEQEIPILTVDASESVEERFTDNAINNILPARYLVKDDSGEVVEEPAELFERVADNVATAEWQFGQEQGLDDAEIQARFEEWRDEFAELMKTQRFMPNSPTLMNAGARLQQLSACFVDSPHDDLADIAETETEWTLVQKTGGGMGGDFSQLRPKGALIDSTKGTSSGPISFMRKFNLVAGVIKQGGVRRGAQMAEMRADHPDIGRFVVAKREEGKFDNFNISVSVTDEFIDAVKNDETYTLYAPQSDFEEPFKAVSETVAFYSPAYEDRPEGEGPGMVETNVWRDHAAEMQAWDWENEETVSFETKWRDRFERAAANDRLAEGEELRLPARFIWDMILDGAWRNGEPGLFHLDETNRKHSFDVEENSEYRINATNPCAEQPLCEYEACNLGHINLSLMLEANAPTYDEWVASVDYEYGTKQAEAYDYFERAVDLEQLDRVIEAGVRFLDNVVTMSEFPLEKIEERVSSMRKIGLGVMGWAHMCYQMGVRYGSEESLQLARVVMNYIDERATMASHDLALERGCFEAWDDSKYAAPTEYPEWFHSHVYRLAEAHDDGYEMRNHNVTTVAPTGTTSMLADTSGGIEPVYNVAYKKNVGGDIQGDDMLVEFDKVFIRTLRKNRDQLDHTPEEIAEIAAEQMDNNEFEGVQSLPVPDWMQETFVTTNDLTPREHGLMQRAFQEGVDSGISKCVAEGTVVKTDDGLTRIEDLGDATEAHADTFAESVDTTVDGNDVTGHYNAGEKPATRVRFDNGQTLTAATASHRVKTTDGWKRVGELQPGDAVRGSYEEAHGDGGATLPWDPAARTNANEIEPPATMSPALAEWLGMVAADGSTTLSNGRVGITHKNETVAQRFTELTRECFGTEPRTQVDQRNGVESIYFTSRDLCRWVRDLIGEDAYTKCVPRAVLSGSADEKLAFARGLTLDGYIHENGLVVYEGMSEDLARDTASMLQSFGAPKVYVSSKTVAASDSTAYGVIVSNEMHDQITPIEPHKQVETISTRYKVYAPTDSYSLDDYETGSDEYYAARSALNRGNDYLFNETATKIALDATEPVYIVTNVENVGTVQMYDIEVEETHEYVSNGVQSHNTVNLPKEATHKDVHEAYMLAVADDELGATIKGLTVYRDQSRGEQVLTTQEYSEIEVENAIELLEDLDYTVVDSDEEPGSGGTQSGPVADY